MNPYELEQRRYTILIFFSFVVTLFVIRLFYLQVVSRDYAQKADRNAIDRQTFEPSRGVLYDRKGRLYVNNKPLFDLMVVPKELVIPDTAILERFLQLDRLTLRRRLTELNDPTKHNPYRPAVLERNLPAHITFQLQEQLWQFRGIQVVSRSSRNYIEPIGAHVLGYIREVDPQIIERHKGYYSQGDLIGINGLESHYETELRGRKGVRLVLKDNRQREIGSFANGAYDTLPEKGKDIQLSIDLELQKLGERLMQNKVGSIVAIEPSTGEILAFVSAPTYDPSLLTGTQFNENFRKLSRDSIRPLINRPMMGVYPPGSIFKVANALIGLQEGIITRESAYGCAMGFLRNRGRPRCHAHAAPLAVEGAIQTSCNAFFAGMYVDLLHHQRYDSLQQAFDRWRFYMDLFGVGRKVGIDIPSEKAGNLPTKAYYNKIYGRKGWKGMTIVSNSIGQGEVTMTPLQMANMAAAIANRGWYIQPHFFKSFYHSIDRKNNPTFKKTVIPIDTAYFRLVVGAMEKVVSAGTGIQAYHPEIPICGKTGTAQNPHGLDHSVFVAFAPMDKPQIAIAVIVENAGWGGDWAAPIAGLMIQQHIKGKIRPEDHYKLQRILDADFIRPRTYSATPIIASDTSQRF